MSRRRAGAVNYGEFSTGSYRDLNRRVTGLHAHHMIADAFLQRQFLRAENFSFFHGGNFQHMMQGVGATDLHDAGITVLLNSSRHRAVHNFLDNTFYNRQSIAPIGLNTRQVAAREHISMRRVGIDLGWYNPENQLNILAAQREGFFLNGYVIFPIVDRQRMLAMPFSQYQALHQAGTLGREIRGATGVWIEPVQTRSRILRRQDPNPNPPRGMRVAPPAENSRLTQSASRPQTRSQTREERPRERSVSPTRKQGEE